MGCVAALAHQRRTCTNNDDEMVGLLLKWLTALLVIFFPHQLKTAAKYNYKMIAVLSH